MQKYHYRGMTFDVPDIEVGNGISFDPEPGPKLLHPLNDSRHRRVLETIGNTNARWDLQEFNHVRLPVPVLALPRNALTFRGIRILDMPIKFPYSEYKLPEILLPYEETIRRVAATELGNVANPHEFYCYITLDQRHVPAGEYMRNKGCHVDGFQGARITTKHRPDHSYLAVNSVATIAYDQAFPCSHLDETKHNFFHYWDKIANPQREKRVLTNFMYLVDTYTIHRADSMPFPVDGRSFFRMSYSVREFDRLGNAHNPMFDYDWKMVPRKVGETLS